MVSDLEREISKAPRVTASFRYGEAEYREDMANDWKVTLRFKGRRLTTDFYGGELVENPNAADVLSSLILDARIGEEDFEDYCANFGVDSDSRSAYATWKACRDGAAKLHRFLGEDFNRFANLEH